MNYKKNKIIIIAIAIAIAVIVIAGIEFAGIQKFNFINGYGFDVEIKDPSFDIVGKNFTTLNHEDITNVTYNATDLSINLPATWNGSSSNYLYQLVNTLSTNVHLTLQNNFTHEIFTYLILPKGENTAQPNVIHNATFEVLLYNNTTGFSTKIIIAHNITSDASFKYIPANNETVISEMGLGDGLPVGNSSVNITIPPNYYVYIGLGNENEIYHFMPKNSYVLSNTNTSKYESGNIKI